MNNYKSRLRKELEDLNFKIEKLNNFIEFLCNLVS